MEGILWIVALVASGLFILKVLISMMGFDSDLDIDAEADLDFEHGMLGDIQLLSLFSILAFFMMGGWGALIAFSSFGAGEAVSLLSGGGVGIAAMFGTAWLLAKVKRLEHDGTLRDFDPKGLRGEVYLKIPPAGEGEGQVKIEVKGRMKIFRAVTDGDNAIDSFKPVEVKNMTSDQVLLVRHTG